MRLQSIIAAAFTGGFSLPTPVLIDSMDAATGWGVSGNQTIATDTTNKVQGTGSLRFKGNGTSGSNILSAKNLPSAKKPSDLGVIAFNVRKNLPRVTQNLALQFGTAGGTFSTSLSVAPNNFMDYASYRNFGQTLPPSRQTWQVFHYSEEPSIQALDPTDAGLLTQMRFRTVTQGAPYCGDFNIDALTFNAKGIPTFVFSFDDGHDTTHDIAMPYMAQYGMVGTVYLPFNPRSNSGTITYGAAGVGADQCLTLAKLQNLYNAGWHIGSDGTPNDSDLTSQASPSAAADYWYTGVEGIVSLGFPLEGALFGCYPNGSSYATGQGSAAAIPSPVQIAAATGNGTTTVSFGATANVSNGFYMYGAGIPDDTYVVSGGGVGVGSVVVNNVIPAQTKAAMFQDQSSPFWFGLLPSALAAKGAKSFRMANGDQTFTRFGNVDWMQFGGAGFTSASLNMLKALVDQIILRGSSVEFYVHRIVADPGGWTADTINSNSIHINISCFYGLIDYIGPKKMAGLCQVINKLQLWNRDKNNTYPF